MSTYDSTKDSLLTLLHDISKGRIQLPEFQRDWVWDDEHVGSLLASVTLSYPIGAVMLLQTGSGDVKFKTRVVEAVDESKAMIPEWLILDGQQRLTVLFQALFSPYPVSTKDLRGKPVNKHYHVDIAAILSANGDREDAIVSLPQDRIQRNFRGDVVADYSTTEKQCAAEMLPLDIVLHTKSLNDWMMAYLQAEKEKMAERLEKWNRLQDSILNPIQQYQVPIIQLKRETPKVAVCQVFEKVNTGGVSLTIFELLTATFAAENFLLRNDWQARDLQIREKPVLKQVKSDDFLQAISLLVTKTRRDDALKNDPKPDQIPGISCKREAILRLCSHDYKKWADTVQQGFLRGAKFLMTQRIYSYKYLPYRSQLVPLAAILAALGDAADADGVRQKIARWLWCGVFGELYGSAIETRFSRDLPEVLEWIHGGSEPITIAESNFVAGRLLRLRSRNSAAYKGLYALLLGDGELDFRTGEPIEAQAYFDDKIDIHHIFPKQWCKKNKVPRAQFNSIINKTAISAATNRKIGGKAPSIYLALLQKQAGISDKRMDEILVSHAIEPGLLRADNFGEFFKKRAEVLLQRIENATGKTITREALLDQEDDQVELQLEEDEMNEEDDDPVDS